MTYNIKIWVFYLNLFIKWKITFLIETKQKKTRFEERQLSVNY